MEKCFICGRDYDEKNRIPAVDVMDKFNKEVQPINEINYYGKVLQLCHYCVKAMAIGSFLSYGNDIHGMQLYNVELIYEEGNDIDAEPEGTGAGLNVAQKQNGRKRYAGRNKR